MPSRIAFEISLFPNNVPLPAPKTSACLIGGTLHFVHFCVRVSQIRSIPESDVGWEDMYREDNNVAWFDWVRSSLIYFTCIKSAAKKPYLFFEDCTHDMSLDHRRVIEHPFPVHPHQAIPPLPPARPRPIPTRAFRLSANESTCARESHAHTRVGFIPRLLAVPTRHHSIILATRK